MEDIILCEGTKEDYIECGNASRKSDKWIVCPEDYDAYVALIGIDKMHHVVAKTKEGEYVGSCLCLEMDDLAMMALYYVRPEFRHKAVGSRIFRKALSTELANAKNIGLHSTPQMSKVYDSALGFNKYANWRSDILAMHNIDISKLSRE
ncbi:unnamed protein product [Toxocara canis]|uniref:N-acetyltransferase domain-containing protein n=1 Tax=Toxocara canis TaxID=6265 RepID=A0A183V5C9_TOXCA|nr:unnamed protein product [Toxocara canis]